MTELAVFMVIRTQRVFYKSKPIPTLIYSSIIIALITLFIPYVIPINIWFNIEPIGFPILLSLFSVTIL